MFKNPLVSVIIPTYGRPKYLRRCIESVLNQTYDNIEIIIVDDNNPGTDAREKTENEMKHFSTYNNVSYLQHEHNKNGAVARNTGWKHAKGVYITYLDDDDEISDTKIEKQVRCLENLDDTWGACYTGYQVIKKNGRKQFSSENRFGNCYVEALMRTMFMGSGSNLFLRKVIVDEIKGYDETFIRNQDIEFLVRVLSKCKIAFINENLLTIHQDGNRITRTFDELEGYTKHYLDKFINNINELPEKDKERVIAVISLERCRVAFYKQRYKDGIEIIKNNSVSWKYIYRYIKYIIYRTVTHKSYGFDGNKVFIGKKKS